MILRRLERQEERGEGNRNTEDLGKKDIFAFVG